MPKPTRKAAPRPVKITANGKGVEVSDPGRIKELNRDLRDPEKFKKFAKNPQLFVKHYGIRIDRSVNDRLKKALVGVDSVSELRKTGFLETRASGDEEATAACIASGAFAWASTKIAVVV